jgi:hypothetical protein
MEGKSDECIRYVLTLIAVVTGSARFKAFGR